MPARLHSCIAGFAVHGAIALALAVAGAPGTASAGILDSVTGLVDSVRDFAREQLVSKLNGLLPGQLAIGAIEGSPMGDLTLRDVTLTYQGETVVSVRRATANVAYSQLLHGDIVLEKLALDRPVLRLRQDAAGNWNLLQAVVAPSPAPGPSPSPSPTAADAGGGGWPLAIQHLEIDDGAVRATPVGATARTYQVAGLDAHGSLRLGAGGPRIQLAGLSATLHGPDVPLARLSGGVTYSGANGGQVVARQLQVRTARSTVLVDGRIDDLSAPTVHGRAALQPLDPADAKQLVSGWPLAADLRGHLRVQGPPSAIDAAATLRSADATLTLKAAADVRGAHPRFEATLGLHHLDPATLAPAYGVGGIVHGRVHVAGTGTALGEMTGTAALAIDQLRAAGRQIGNAEMHATLDDGDLAFRSTILGNGRAHLDGKLGFATQRYRLDLAVDDLRAAALAGAQALPETRLNLAAHLQGRGFSPADATLSARVDVQPSTVGPVAVDDGHVVARVAGGRLELQEARLVAAGASAAVEGELGLGATRRGRLTFDVRAPRLEPFLEIAGQQGGGALALHGVASGRLGDLAVKGSAQLEHVSVSGNSLRSGTAHFDLSGIGTAAMTGTLATELTQVEAGIAFAALETNVDVQSGQPFAADFAVAARTVDGRPQALRGAVRMGAQQTSVQLRRVALDVPGGAWTLADPATVTIGAAGIAVDSLVLRNGAESLTVDGRLGREQPGVLRVTAQNIDLGLANAYAPKAVSQVQGVLAADLQVRGTLADPKPSGTVTLSGGQAHVAPLGVTIENVVARIDADPDRLQITELSARAGDGTLDVDGVVRLRDERPAAIDVHLRAVRWPAIDTAQTQAQIDAAIDVDGTPAAPVVEGRIDVRQATLRPELSMLTEASGPAPRDPTIVVIQEERAKELAGPTKARGGAPFDVGRALQGLAIDLQVDITDHTWIKHDAASLALLGRVTVHKDPGADLSLIGQVRVVQGWILFRGHRFRLQEGEVRFTGGHEINPSLDVVLETRVSEYTVQLIVGGTAAKPSLAFASQPELPDSDILALLLFGRRVNQLDSGEQESLQQQAGGLAASFAASRLATAISDQLGLGLVITEVDVTNGGFGVGRYLTPNTFVSVSQELGGTAERQVSIEYYLTPHWSLSTSTDTQGENTADVFWRWQY